MPDDIPKDIFEQYERKKLEEGAPLEPAEIPAGEKAEPRGKAQSPAEKFEREREVALGEIGKMPEKPEEIAQKGLSQEQREKADAKVEDLVLIAQTEGKQAALKKAENDDQYTLDRLQARLVEEERKLPDQQ